MHNNIKEGLKDGIPIALGYFSVSFTFGMLAVNSGKMCIRDRMNRNLLYTAVTRARKCVTLVGDENTFWEMEKNQMEQSRYTTLDLRIKESC